MLAASRILTQVELDFAVKRSDAVWDRKIRMCKIFVSLLLCTDLSLACSIWAVDVLKRAASLSDDWIPDNDLYNIRRRVHKLLSMTGINSPEPPSTAPPTGESHSGNTASTQFGDKVPGPLAVPIVKRGPSEPRTLPLSFRRGPTATKRRHEEGSSANKDANVDDSDGQIRNVVETWKVFHGS
jgi:hypothetical protein